MNEYQRNLSNNYRTLKSQLNAQKQIVKELDESVKLSRRNYREHVKDGNQGLVSQLDVLRAHQQYLQAQRQYHQQFYLAKIKWVQLRGLVGIRP